MTGAEVTERYNIELFCGALSCTMPGDADANVVILLQVKPTAVQSVSVTNAHHPFKR